jgi:hypothetical protein
MTGTRTPTAKFTGDIDWVQIDLSDDSRDYLSTPEDRRKVVITATRRQTADRDGAG